MKKDGISMMEIFFIMLIISLLLLVFAAGCARTLPHDNMAELFNTASAKCQAGSCSEKFSVATQEATDVGSNMVQLNGHIESTGAMWWFEYGPSQDQLKYSTEPEMVSITGPVKAYLKKLAPITQYFYRVVGQNRQGKINGEVYFVTTVDVNCFGAGTLASFLGAAVIASGAVVNPSLIIGGLVISSSGVFDEEVFGNAADSRCKAAAGLLGAGVGYWRGTVYKDAHKPPPQQSPPPQQNNNPPPQQNPGGPGPTNPDTGPSGPTSPPN